MSYFINEMKNISYENESNIKKEAFDNFYIKHPEYIGKIFFISYLLPNEDILINLDGYNTNAVIDKPGNFKLEFIYVIHNYCINSLFLCTNNKHQYGFLNQNYDEVIPFIYNQANPFDKYGKAKVCKAGRDFYINDKGEELNIHTIKKNERHTSDIFHSI